MRGKGKNRLLPSSLKLISSCLKTVSSNAGSVANTVRSAGASVAASIIVPPEDEKDQVLWAGFDLLELGPSSLKHVLLVGYANGFQVLDVEDASNVSELVSRRDGPVTFLQMQPTPVKSDSIEGFIASHPLLLVVAGEETNGSGAVYGGHLSASNKEVSSEPQPGNCISTPTIVRFYSLKSHNYVHVLRFRSAVYIVRCSPQIVAVALAAQIYCFDAVTLENKFIVLTYPIQGAAGVNIGYGPMAVGPRWLAYASNNPIPSSTGRLSPQNLTPSPGVSPSTSPGSGNSVARYAMESSKQLAAGILNLGDVGYKTLSKYCQERLPDGSSSPLSPNSGRRSAKFQQIHSSETDNAGMVVIKDFVSKAIVSQFKAHASPISALCFDPSGTLLVTASIHGHNINVFRIMPTQMQHASGTAAYDWSSSHVHLYKLYRGITAAVIQDICFSHYSQWVSVVSSKGTCHIYVLSPFGGDVSLQLQSSYGDGPFLMPNLTLPWWSSSCCMIHQQFHPPPSAITYSVVSRIKNNHSGWLNMVSSVAASATGKISAPSGAISAVFHNSIYQGNRMSSLEVNALEHLLVFSPSGHVIQLEFLPSLSAESCDSSPRAVPASLLQYQEEELHVNAEPVQWWDVCRRSNWPERDDDFSTFNFSSRLSTVSVMDMSDSEDNESVHSVLSTDNLAGRESVKNHERSRWFLSNAEVQINSGMIPVWQKSKICFYTVCPKQVNERLAEDSAVGEFEIEKLPLREVEIRRKDVHPVFELYNSSQSDCKDRDFGRHSYQSSPSGPDRTKEKFTRDAFSGNVQLRSAGCRSDYGVNSAHLKRTGQSISGLHSPVSSQPLRKPIASEFIKSPDLENESSVSGLYQNNASTLMPIKYSDHEDSQLQPEHHNDSDITGVSTLSNSFPYPVRMVSDAHSSDKGIGDDVSSSHVTNDHIGNPDTPDCCNSVEFTQYFHEGYCKVSELDDCGELTEAVADADSSSSHCEREKPEEDGENEDILGGVFAFSEEG